MTGMYFKTGILVFIMALSFNVNAQFDDLYYDYNKDAITYTSKSDKAEVAPTNIQQDYYADESDYDDQEYGNYDEYSYADRITRFHGSSSIAHDYYNNSFDDWWYNDNYYYGSNYYRNNYYDNFFYPSYGNSVNIYIGSSWGWNRPWGFNSYYSPWGWNGYYNPWNSWNKPWGFNSHYSPWGWNSYYGYGGNIINNHYYGDVYYGNGYYNNGWYNSNTGSNAGNTSNTIYGSRRGGAVSSSVNGREASPRKPGTTTGGGHEVRQDAAAEGLKEDNTLRGNNVRVKDTDNTQRTESVRTEEVKSNSGQRDRIFNSSSNSGVKTNERVNTQKDTPRNNNNSGVRNDSGVRNQAPSTQPTNTRSSEPPRSNTSRSMDSGSSRSNPSNSGSYRESSSQPRSSSINNSGSMNSSRSSSGGSTGNSGSSSSSRSGSGSQRGGR